MREALQKQHDQASAAHEKNRLAYRAALKARDEADAAVRKACNVASESANVLAAVKKALADLPPAKLEAVE